GPVPLPPLLSFCGLLARTLLFGLLPLPPLGQLPPLQSQSFSSCLMISSSRITTSFCIFWVFGPPRDRSSRRSLLPILLVIQPRSLSRHCRMSKCISAATILCRSGASTTSSSKRRIVSSASFFNSKACSATAL